MDLTTWLDVAIGLTLVYLGVSLFVTIINEYIAQLFNLRGKQLYASLNQLIDNDDIRKTLRQNPALESFFSKQPKHVASYVDPQIFAQILIGSLLAAGNSNGKMDQITLAIDKLPNSSLKAQLQGLVFTAGEKIENLIEAVGSWLDRSLTMMGECYKRKLQTISFSVGLAVAVILNINTITLTEHLYRDKETRNATTALAIQFTEGVNKEKFTKCQESPEMTSCIALKGLTDAIQKRNESLGRLPIGWPDTSTLAAETFQSDSSEIIFWVKRLIGWFLTALAISLGAPFWFDTLNRVVSIRHGMRKPGAEKSDKSTYFRLE